MNDTLKKDIIEELKLSIENQETAIENCNSFIHRDTLEQDIQQTIDTLNELLNLGGK